jgi:hypothetical protein
MRQLPVLTRKNVHRRCELLRRELLFPKKICENLCQSVDDPLPHPAAAWPRYEMLIAMSQ